MKKILIAFGLVMAGMHAMAGPNIGVSVSVNQPGVYGRIDIGHVPQAPVVIYPQPVVVAPPSVSFERRPIYLHVPQGHSKNWRKHCQKYNACNQPVYFVRDDWYRNHYEPQRRRVHHAPPPPPPRMHHRDERRHDGPGRGPGKGHDRHHHHDRHGHR